MAAGRPWFLSCAGLRLVFRYGHEHRSAVDLYGINLIAMGREELPRHTPQLVGVEIRGFADAVQKAAWGDLLSAIHVFLAPSLNPASPRRGFERNGGFITN